MGYVRATTAASIRCALGEARHATWLAVPAVVELDGDAGGGAVVTAAVDQHHVLAFQAGGDSVRLWSLNHGDIVEVGLDGRGIAGDGLYARVATVTAELNRRGRRRVGLEGVVLAEPLSAALGGPMLELAVALALTAVADSSSDADELADACQAARRAGGQIAHRAEARTALAAAAGTALLFSGTERPRPVRLEPDAAFVIATAPADVLANVADEMEEAGATHVHVGGFGRRDHVVATTDALGAETIAVAVDRGRRRGDVLARAHVCRPASARSADGSAMFPLHLPG